MINQLLYLVIISFSLCIKAFPQMYPAVVFNGTGLGWQEKLAAMSLAGIVNRDSSRLYLLNVYETWSNSATDETWRDIYIQRGNVSFRSISLLQDLISYFRPYINGAITYDPNKFFSNFSGQNFNFQAEQAAVIAGLSNCLPLTVTTANVLNIPLRDSLLISDSFNDDTARYVTGRLELATHPWNNTALTLGQQYLKLIEYGINRILPVCNPSKFYLREITDWTIQQKMYQVNFAGTEDLNFNSFPTAQADLLEQILIYLRSKNPLSLFHIYGWMRPEPLTQWFAYFGASFHETLLANISFHHSFPVSAQVLTPPASVNPDTLFLQDKYYLVFIGTEGDAGNWVFGLQSGAWQSATRGNVPVGWGWNLHLFNEAPFVAKYYFSTGTKQDGFLSVISPLGYAYPDLFQSEVRPYAVSEAKELFAKYGIKEVYGYKHYASASSVVYRGKTISNSYNFSKYGAFQKDIGANLSFLFDPLLPTQQPNTAYSGALLFNHVNDGTFYGNVSDLNTAASNILSLVRNKPRPGFFLAGYQRLRQDNFSARTDPSTVDISLPRLAQLRDLLRQDTLLGRYIEVVTPETFSVLLRKKLGILSAHAPIRGALKSELQVFPNPASEIITVQSPQADGVMGIYSITGEKVYERKVSTGEAVSVNISGLPEGVFVVSVVSEKGRKAVKVVINR